MSRTVQIWGDRAVFPVNACVHCMRPSTRDVEIVKVKGYVVRRVGVPFCDECIALREAKSPLQVRFERVAVVNSILLAMAVGMWVLVSISSEPAFRSDRVEVWGLLLGLLVAMIVFGVMYLVVQPWSRRFRSAETKAALRAVTIKAFDWDTTTLEFANQEYAERFAQVNRAPQEGPEPGNQLEKE
ncbi:MAG: hypothetical protein H8D77_02105 [Chloroflexi bacterium]|nr:hypothetical protein [Chloroflexota bacterium]MBL7201155.1 hypothetical protein [Anaerolineae bacterium]